MTKFGLRKELDSAYDKIDSSIKAMQEAYQDKAIKGQRATDAFNLIKQAQNSISRALDTLNL